MHIIEEGNYRIRPIRKADLEMVLQWRNSNRIRRYMYSDHQITMKEHRSWFRSLAQNTLSIVLVLEQKRTPLGVVTISRIDRANKVCHWGFYLGDTAGHSGRGMALGYFGLEYIFKKLKMRKVCGETLAFNEASIRFHGKLGFQQEGYLTKHILKGNKYRDLVFMSLFQKDWSKRANELKKKILPKGKIRERN